jgi:thymidine kinase
MNKLKNNLFINNKYKIYLLLYNMHKNGYLQLIIGPMYAGKSTELIKIINRYKCLNKKITIINHIFNNRYGSNGLTTHNREKIDKCIILEHLQDLDKNEFENVDVIIIEELQFFDDAYNTIIDWCDNHGKIVVAAGLDGDFMRNPFGDVLKLIPHAEKITKLSALCKKCGDGTLAHFTKRITNDCQTTLVGSDDIYEAVCRKHYCEGT